MGPGNMPPNQHMGPGRIPPNQQIETGNMPPQQQRGPSNTPQPSNQPGMYPTASSASYPQHPNAQGPSYTNQQPSGLYPTLPTSPGHPQQMNNSSPTNIQQEQNQPGGYPVTSVYPGYSQNYRYGPGGDSMPQVPSSYPGVNPGMQSFGNYIQAPNQPAAYPATPSPIGYQQQQYPSASSQMCSGSNQSNGYSNQPPSSGYSTNPSKTYSYSDKRIKKARIEAIDRILCIAEELEPKVLGFNGRRGKN
jgi:hypothetical protein